MNYVKMSELVGQDFTIIKVGRFSWKKYNTETKKMEVSETFRKSSEGFRKVYSVETDRGLLDVSEGQMGVMLEKALKGNKSDLSNVIFEVGSNGKTGVDIRYYFKIKGTDYAKKVEKVEEQEIPIEEYPSF